jgi:putative acetyltransferase
MADRVRVDAEKFDSPDARALRGELEAELIERYGGDLEPGEKPSAADVAVFLVARGEDGDALGCGGLRELGGGAVELKRMYVRPAARGRGVGGALLEALEREARRLGFSVARLETGVEQPEAQALYRRHGYREIPCFGAYAGSPPSRCFERRLG